MSHAVMSPVFEAVYVKKLESSAILLQVKLWSPNRVLNVLGCVGCLEDQVSCSSAPVLRMTRCCCCRRCCSFGCCSGCVCSCKCGFGSLYIVHVTVAVVELLLLLNYC